MKKLILFIIYIVLTTKNISLAGCGPAGCAVKLPLGDTTSVNPTIQVAPSDLVGLGRQVLSGFIHIIRTSDNLEIETINVNNFYSPNSITSGTFSFPLQTTLDFCTQYKVVVDANVFKAVCSSGGFMGQTIWYFKTALPYEVVTDQPDSMFVTCGDWQPINCLNNNTGNSTYQWYRNGTLINGETQNFILPTQTGSYTVVFIEDFLNGCAGVSTPTYVSINPFTQFSLNVPNTLDICEGNQVTLSSNYISSDCSYQWYFQGSIMYDNDTLPNYLVGDYSSSYGSGNYQLIITNNTNNCQASSSVNVNFHNPSSQILKLPPSCLTQNDGLISVYDSETAGSVNGSSFFISEYYNGNGSNKVIEIYNSTNSTIDIGGDFGDPSAGYSIRYLLRNSSNQEYYFPTNTLISPHGVILVANPIAGGNVLNTSVIDGSEIKLAWYSPEFQYGEDWDIVIPVIGQTIIRNSFIDTNNSIFNSTEWQPDQLINNSLGVHQYPINNSSIIWSNGSTNHILNNLSSGTNIFNSYTSSLGCQLQSDTINLYNSVSSSFQTNICYGTTYTWGNQQYSHAGQYQQTFTNQFGCDSVVTLNLTIIPNNFNPTFSSTQQLFTAPPFAVQFSNSTANASNYSFMWDFGDGTTLASNNATVFHQYLYNGQYTVSLIATSNTTGCTDTTTLSDYIFCTGGVSCTHTAAINQTSPQQACQSTPLWLTCNNDPSFSYQWRRNGVAIPGNNNDSLLITQSGTYSVLISVNNCPVTSSDVVVNILPAPATPVIASSGVIQPCVGGSVTLNTGSYATYNWSTGATTQSINVSSSGTYTVSVTGANSCSATSAPFNVNASFVTPPQVCIVGMDSLTNENRIVWEKPITNGIDSFYVYKESNVSNVYTKIGATDYIDLAVFLDVNSNPAVQAYRYKISALDTCGVETNVGDFHKTIHLTINQGIGGAWNLIWSHYEGLNFGSYNIYRGTDPSNISLLTTIQSNLNSYTDLTPPTGPLYYQIEVVNPVNCDPTKNINYGVSRSNIVNNGLVGNIEEINSFLQVYPNPSNEKLTLGVSNDLLGKQYIITDFSGRMILQGEIIALNQIIEFTNVSNGSYFLKVDNSNANAIKIMKH